MYSKIRYSVRLFINTLNLLNSELFNILASKKLYHNHFMNSNKITISNSKFNYFALVLLFILSVVQVSGQTEETFPHCNCTEIRTADTYKVTSNNVVVEEGHFLEGKRDGTWISRDVKGNVIRKVNYKGGNLDNSYELFYRNGKPKVSGIFRNGRPDGEWNYYNKSGKVIKHGSYNNGAATGVWTIFDKKGKKPIAEYDFDNNKEILNPNGKQYFSNGGLAQDEQSGEWMLIYLPSTETKVAEQPVGGYVLANDLFMSNFSLPTLLMNTKNTLEYVAKVRFNKGVIQDISIETLDKTSSFDISSHYFSFMVSTNKESKLHNVKPSKATVEFLNHQLMEYIWLAGPWVNAQNTEINIQIPLVINNFKKL